MTHERVAEGGTEGMVAMASERRGHEVMRDAFELRHLLPPTVKELVWIASLPVLVADVAEAKILDADAAGVEDTCEWARLGRDRERRRADVDELLEGRAEMRRPE